MYPNALFFPLQADRVDCVTFLEAVTLRVALEETGQCREDESPTAPLLGFPSSGDSSSSEKQIRALRMQHIFRSDYEAKLAKITVEIVCESFTVPNLLLSSLQSSSLSKVTLFSWVDTEKYNTKLVTVLRFFWCVAWTCVWYILY